MADRNQSTEMQINDGDFGDSLPTQFANRFYIRKGPVVSRLMMGEIVSPDVPTRWHCAMAVPTEDLEALATLIFALAGRDVPPAAPAAPNTGKPH